MDLNYIKKLVSLVDQSSVSELEIVEGETKIKISKKTKSSYASPQPHYVHVPAAPEQMREVTTASVEKTSTPAEEKKTNQFEVVSPMVGTFYRSPSPEAEPYIRVGDVVSPGTVLCIIEAMKLMNEIECEVQGKIVKVLVDDGKPVEFNQPLFLIEKS